MLGRIINKLFGNNSKKSKGLAKSRLHFVLVQDRAGLTNKELASFKTELVSVIEKYFVIDKNGFDINYERDNDTTKLIINSPIIIRRQDSIKNLVGTKRLEKDTNKQKNINPQGKIIKQKELKKTTSNSTTNVLPSDNTAPKVN